MWGYRSKEVNDYAEPCWMLKPKVLPVDSNMAIGPDFYYFPKFFDLLSFYRYLIACQGEPANAHVVERSEHVGQ